MKRLTFFLLILSALFITLIPACDNKPTEPVNDSPFDPQNEQGDNIPPTIKLELNKESGITNETEFVFDASKSFENDNINLDLYFMWDMDGDGIYEDKGIDSTYKKITFTEGGGNKNIKLSVMGYKRLTSDTTVTIFVNTRPVASFTMTRDNSNYKLYHFDASASTDYEDGENIEYRWDLNGDGGWETSWLALDTISYEYTNDGDFNTKLTVRDQNALTAEQVVQVSVVSSMTDQDGNIYKIVKIGAQWWMAENLKVTHYRNGESIPNVTDNSEWAGLSTGARCAYNNDNGNVATYGLLYNWYAVDDNRKIAPAGWHVPTDEEWKALEMYLGMSQIVVDSLGWRGTDEGSKLKTESGWNSGGNGNNESGFTALPSGWRNYYGEFYSLGSYGAFWSSSQYSSLLTWHRGLLDTDTGIYRYYGYNSYGLSVRLVRD